MKRLVVTIIAFALLAPAAQAADHGLATAVAEPGIGGDDGALLGKRIKGAGATSVRMYISWRSIAPGGATKPAGFDARNPADPAYNWDGSDRAIRTAVAAGLQPIVTVVKAPDWAERRLPEDAALPGGELIEGTVRPVAAEFGAFGEAIARRYSGTFAGLPRVRWWQPWNEPNHHNDLNPQFAIAPTQDAARTTPIAAAAVYRELLAAFSAAVHRVRADNLVIAGGLAPFFRPRPGGRASAPLTFMRELLCLTAANRPRANCPGALHFDVWGQHPYTSGDADHSANSPDDVSLGDLGEVRRVLNAAASAKRIVSRRPVRLWVTEFSWDSSPPDRFGVPDKLLTRWTAEALHRMWKRGADLVTWFQVRDAPPIAEGGVFQSGLYLRCATGPACDRPKPNLAAFRFPFVAYRSSGAARIWGRTPAGRRVPVIVQQRRGARWVRLARIVPDRFGIFERRLRLRGGGDLRARLATTPRNPSPPFSLRRVPDRAVNPFGNVPVDEP